MTIRSQGVVTAKPGDEVRWINTTSGPVDLAFVDALDGRVLSGGVRVRKMGLSVRSVGARVPRGRDPAQSRLCQSLFFNTRDVRLLGANNEGSHR